MSEYWKSNPKKFCEYCKIWIQGNKASISIHENGGNHKDKVRRRLQEIKKKSIEKKNEEKEIGRSMAAIERAALAAMQSDILSNPSLRNQYGLETKAKSTESISSSHPSTSKDLKNEEKKIKRQEIPLKRLYVPESESKIGKWENSECKRAYLDANADKANYLQLPTKEKKIEKKVEAIILKKEVKEENNSIDVKTETKEEDFKSKWKPIENLDSSQKSENQEESENFHSELNLNETLNIGFKKEPNEEKIPAIKNSDKKEKKITFKKRSKEVNLRQRNDD